MDIRQLEYFVTVVEEKTVTAAAEKLNMTQPPLTMQLHLLEDDIGCKLFRREGRNICLTDAGQFMYKRAVEILGMCKNVMQEMSDFCSGTMGTLRIGVISSVQGNLFAEWLKFFSLKYPNVKLAIKSANTYELLDKLKNREIDMAIIRTPFPAKNLEVEYLNEEDILAIGHKSFFNDKKINEVSLSDITNLPLILYRRWQGVIESTFEAAGLKPNVYCVNDDASMTLLLVMQGLGVGLLHQSALPSKLDSSIYKIKLNEKSLSSKIALVCQNKNTLPESAQLFWDLVKSLNK